MWILSWSNYKNSKFATFISVIGALCRYAGVICLVNGLILAAVICIAIGIGMHFLAEYISKSKENKAVSGGTAQTAKKPVENTNPASGLKCPKCGAGIISGSKFCNACGSRVDAAEKANPAAGPKCPKCGAGIISGSKFCNDCGSRVGAPVREKKCLRCGELLDGENKLCRHCGYQNK